MKRKNLIKAIAFALIFMIGFCTVSKVMTVSTDDWEYQWMTGIYEEPEDSLDAVYIGSSNCYAFWNQNLAWEEYGIAVYPYTCSTQPLLIAEYLIKEARKTQPDAVYVVNINTLGGGGVPEATMHRLLDFMPLSVNKLELAEYMCDLAGYSFSERLPYYLPIVKYHSRWDELTEWNFSEKANDIKGGNQYSWYLNRSIDISENYKMSDETCEISDTLTQSLESLLDYCDEENVKVVFVTVPRAEDKEENIQKFNTVNQMISDRGYDTLFLMDSTDELGIDITTDYYNNTHTNIHGSIKYTYYISEYLIDKYGFEDKRDNDAYSSWNDSYSNYSQIIAPYVLSIELDSEHRTYELSAPASLAAQPDDSCITVSWEEVEGADGYAVFRKIDSGAWTELGDLQDTAFCDEDVQTAGTYTYTVVPFLEDDGERYYGNFSYSGVGVKVEEVQKQ